MDSLLQYIMISIFQLDIYFEENGNQLGSRQGMKTTILICL